MDIKYENKYAYNLPIKIGTEIFTTICMGTIYHPEEIDKCSGWKVALIRINADGINFEIRKGESMEGWIPLKYLGKLYFLNKEDAINRMNELIRMYEDDTLDDYLDEIYKSE